MPTMPVVLIGLFISQRTTTQKHRFIHSIKYKNHIKLNISNLNIFLISNKTLIISLHLVQGCDILKKGRFICKVFSNGQRGR